MLIVLSKALLRVRALLLQPLDLLALGEEVTDGALAAEEVAVSGAGDDGGARGMQAEAT